ncbi:hypothetical protein EVG20_g8290 [Dentipellis fragilis]|uniref:F-box domain-containing protein n=1 Tax=Dentipellis fragilis TaxID=205917 RepID=A0A4Y9Y7D0_9AGAM|nr:hypothetical protein EVG20_g8290 [Dentipellis fragilis]
MSSGPLSPLSSISDLPTELLLEIFTCLRDTCPPCRKLDETKVAIDFGWIAVTHVCSHWRQLGIKSASLWSDLSFNLGQRWAKEMLVRAKDVGICFVRDAKVDGKNLDEFEAAFLWEHFERIRELRLLCYGCNGLEELLRHAPRSAAHLRVLELTPYASMSRNCSAIFQCIIHHNLSLRILSLSNCSVPWAPEIYSGLTLLDLNLNMFDGDKFAHNSSEEAVASFCNIFGALQSAAPSLQSLALGMIAESSFNGHINNLDAPTVDLPHVSSLKLLGDPCFVALVLQHLDIPSLSQLEVDCQHINWGIRYDLDIHSIISPLKCKIDEISMSPPVTHLHIDQIPGLSLSAYSSFDTPCRQRKFYICLNDRKYDYYVPWIEAFFSHIHLPALTSLEIQLLDTQPPTHLQYRTSCTL